jgi:hypothetical protein
MRLSGEGERSGEVVAAPDVGGVCLVSHRSYPTSFGRPLAFRREGIILSICS